MPAAFDNALATKGPFIEIAESIEGYFSQYVQVGHFCTINWDGIASPNPKDLILICRDNMSAVADFMTADVNQQATGGSYSQLGGTSAQGRIFYYIPKTISGGRYRPVFCSVALGASNTGKPDPSVPFAGLAVMGAPFTIGAEANYVSILAGNFQSYGRLVCEYYTVDAQPGDYLDIFDLYDNSQNAAGYTNPDSTHGLRVLYIPAAIPTGYYVVGLRHPNGVIAARSEQFHVTNTGTNAYVGAQGSLARPGFDLIHTGDVQQANWTILPAGAANQVGIWPVGAITDAIRANAFGLTTLPATTSGSTNFPPITSGLARGDYVIRLWHGGASAFVAVSRPFSIA